MDKMWVVTRIVIIGGCPLVADALWCRTKMVSTIFCSARGRARCLCWYLVVPVRCRYARSSSSLEKCVHRSENILEASRKGRGIIALLMEVKKQEQRN